QGQLRRHTQCVGSEQFLDIAAIRREQVDRVFEGDAILHRIAGRKILLGSVSGSGQRGQREKGGEAREASDHVCPRPAPSCPSRTCRSVRCWISFNTTVWKSPSVRFAHHSPYAFTIVRMR